jgi:hypothetical protein
MLYQDRIKNLIMVYPHLSRVWIKTADPKTPLKGLWIDETKLHRGVSETCSANRQSETAEVAEDHLPMAA